DDLDLAHELLAHVEAAHEMRGHADVGELHHQVFADAVVEHALAGDRALLLLGDGVVLEILHDGAGLGPLEQHLGLALLNLAAARHGLEYRNQSRGMNGWRVRRDPAAAPRTSWGDMGLLYSKPGPATQRNRPALKNQCLGVERKLTGRRRGSESSRVRRSR